ncbi:Hpt domain-containing protein [Tenacibaculum agarivorans]|uniref:Hpt domain-containing protein n=1 Tax=Tenacibaculum agarivorans TaxID=1908389 RepID=UPI00094BB1D3|nr:Hpt domain-containing protein [Tenacibaculum agarivorans]
MNLEQPNLNYIKELSGGDVDFEQKMLSILKNELPTEIEVYEKNIENQDFKKVAEIVHKIKHKISILGLPKSHEFAVQFENELRNENMQKHESFLKLLKLMSNFLDKV